VVLESFSFIDSRAEGAPGAAAPATAPAVAPVGTAPAPEEDDVPF